MQPLSGANVDPQYDLTNGLPVLDQKYAVHSLFPEAKEKIHTLKGFLKLEGHEDVHDPFGGDLNTYERTFNELSGLMDILERKLTGGS